MWCNQVSCVFCCTEKKSSELYRYNVPVLILIRPPLLKWKTGLVTCKSGLSWRGQFTSIFLGVASLEGDILLEFSYLIAFKIWPYKEWNKVCLKNTIILPWLWKKTQQCIKWNKKFDKKDSACEIHLQQLDLKLIVNIQKIYVYIEPMMCK